MASLSLRTEPRHSEARPTGSGYRTPTLAPCPPPSLLHTEWLSVGCPTVARAGAIWRLASPGCPEWLTHGAGRGRWRLPRSSAGAVEHSSSPCPCHHNDGSWVLRGRIPTASLPAPGGETPRLWILMPLASEMTHQHFHYIPLVKRNHSQPQVQGVDIRSPGSLGAFFGEINIRGETRKISIY